MLHGYFVSFLASQRKNKCPSERYVPVPVIPHRYESTSTGTLNTGTKELIITLHSSIITRYIQGYILRVRLYISYFTLGNINVLWRRRQFFPRCFCHLLLSWDVTHQFKLMLTTMRTCAVFHMRKRRAHRKQREESVRLRNVLFCL